MIETSKKTAEVYRRNIFVVPGYRGRNIETRKEKVLG